MEVGTTVRYKKEVFVSKDFFFSTHGTFPQRKGSTLGGIQAGMCGIHHVMAGECFHLHYPNAHRKSVGEIDMDRTEEVETLSKLPNYMLDALQIGANIKLTEALARGDREIHTRKLASLLAELRDEIRKRPMIR